jgi:hypothetical protein
VLCNLHQSEKISAMESPSWALNAAMTPRNSLPVAVSDNQPMFLVSTLVIVPVSAGSARCSGRGDSHVN